MVTNKHVYCTELHTCNLQVCRAWSLQSCSLHNSCFFAKFFLVTLLNLFTMSKSKDPRYFLLDTVPTDDDKVMTGARLPTARQVLLCFLAHHSSEGNTRRQAANLTVQTVLPFYERARIMTLAQHKMAEEVLKVFDEMKPCSSTRENQCGEVQQLQGQTQQNNEVLAKKCSRKNYK